MVLAFIARVPYIFPDGFKLNLTREEYFHYSIPLNKALLFVHIAAVLPAGLLAVLQFVPRIRYRSISYHRIAGRTINALLIISMMCAWGIARVSFGGDLSIQLGLYVLGFTILSSMFAGWAAIRRLQIGEHRKWMIRAWGYQMSVVTLRLIMALAMAFVGLTGGYYTTMSCAEVAHSLNDPDLFAREYPQCLPNWSGKPVTHVSIEAGLDSDLALAAGTQVTFGMSIWVGLWIHAIGVEYYLFKTKDESERLHEVSTKRQNARRGLLAVNEEDGSAK